MDKSKSLKKHFSINIFKYFTLKFKNIQANK